MITIGLLRNGKEEQHRREFKNVLKKVKELDKSEIPQFSFGASELGLHGENQREELEDFVKRWFENPGAFLNFKKFLRANTPPSVTEKNERKEKCYCFDSFLDEKDIAKFFESKQPFYGRGEKIAFIILTHWNAFFHKYKHGTAFIRELFLPVATYRYFPEYQTEKVFAGKSRYDIVGPNIGLTIKGFWQDILNIQYFAEFLKEKMGYSKVGIWAYSIGSPRGYLTSMFSAGLIDFLIMNFLAYSFPQSLLHGIATRPISKELLKNLNEDTIEFLLSPLSPGQYTKYLGQLPQHTRLVQSKYDLVFGEENNKRMVEEFREHAPFIEIEYGNFGHTTFGEIEKVIPVIYRNSRFVFRNSKLRFFL